MSTVIVWFRRDLRLTDNPALTAALAVGAVLPVYVHDPAGDGAWAAGSASRWWLHHSLAALEATLRERGLPLVIRRGDSLETLRALAKESGAAAVHWNRLYEPATVARDTRLKAALRESGLAAQSHAAALLHEPSTLKTSGGEPYRVFTPFWRRFQQEVQPPAPLPAPRLPALAAPPRGEPLAALKLLPRLDWAARFPEFWQPGEAGALKQLRAFIRRALADYREGRDYPARSGVSYLSPHLHFGEVSPRQVWHAVQGAAHGRGVGAETYLREIGWREFAHHVLFNFPHTPEAPMYAKYAAFPWRRDHARMLRAWQRGETGYPIVDAGMRELWVTGWMHNRVRMLAASLLVKNLRVPWQEGARWFWETLVDADLANNTMGWQWSAGCGADAAPYFRIFNPVTQSERFDASGDYIRRWVPELASLTGEAVHAPWQAGGAKGYPAPVVDYAASRAEALEALSRLKSA